MFHLLSSTRASPVHQVCFAAVALCWTRKGPHLLPRDILFFASYLYHNYAVEYVWWLAKQGKCFPFVIRSWDYYTGFKEINDNNRQLKYFCITTYIWNYCLWFIRPGSVNTHQIHYIILSCPSSKSLLKSSPKLCTSNIVTLFFFVWTFFSF